MISMWFSLYPEKDREVLFDVVTEHVLFLLVPVKYIKDYYRDINVVFTLFIRRPRGLV
jgi:hypothetical protein